MRHSPTNADDGCDRMRLVAPVATRFRLLRRFRCSASLRSFASLRRSRSSKTQTTHRVVRTIVAFVPNANEPDHMRSVGLVLAPFLIVRCSLRSRDAP